MIRLQPFTDTELQRLVERLNDGEVEVLWILVDGYRARLRSVLMSRYRELLELTEEADDAIIDAFSNLVRKWPLAEPIRDHRCIERWLHTVVQRWTIDQWRRNRRLQRWMQVNSSRVVDWWSTAEVDRGAKRALDEAMGRYIQGLDPASRFIWEGRLYRRESYADLAGTLGWSRNRVKHRLVHLRRGLRSFLNNSDIR